VQYRPAVTNAVGDDRGALAHPAIAIDDSPQAARTGTLEDLLKIGPRTKSGRRAIGSRKVQIERVWHFLFLPAEVSRLPAQVNWVTPPAAISYSMARLANAHVNGR
jgi:hypothetical protein